MPSSIQTSPPAMHRRSLHPNRIYPAINGLDPLVDNVPSVTAARMAVRKPISGAEQNSADPMSG